MLRWLKNLLYDLCDRLAKWMVDIVAKIEDSKAEPPRKQEVDITTGNVLPPEILAIVRVTYYRNGKAIRLDEFRLMEEGEEGFVKLNELVGHCLKKGANVGVLTEWPPEIINL